MSRLSIALCLSTSIVALVVAGFALFESRSSGTEAGRKRVQDLHELQTLLISLQERVGGLEARHDALTLRKASIDRPKQNTESPAPVPAGELREQVAALAQRLASLEDEETIAQLAQSGRVRVAEKELRGAIDLVGDPQAAPDARLDALKRLRIAAKRDWPMMEEIMGKDKNVMHERDIVLPMLQLAQDTRLEPDFRADVVRNLQGSKLEELRQPMLDLLVFDNAPEVRGEALTALMWHLDDSTIRETITQVSREDRHEDVRARAEEFLPKVEYVARMEADTAQPAGEKK